MKKNFNKPAISVIMATYNSEKFLQEAILSILNQTFKNFEFIIIDDASSDNTKKILEKYQAKDRRIKLIFNKTNLGRGAVRNQGLKIAQGKYIAILDSDDVACENRLEKQFLFLENHKKIFLLGGNIIKINKDSKKISNPAFIETNPKKIIKGLEKKCCLFHPTVMFRNHGYYYREKFFYAQDYDLYLRLLLQGKKIANLNEFLIFYRIHENSASSSQRLKQYLFGQKARDFYFQFRNNKFDGYKNFDPKSILNLDLKKVSDQKSLNFLIRDSYFAKKNKTCQFYALKYFKNYGFFNKNLLYFLVSFFNF